jgi:hypothetical protein
MRVTVRTASGRMPLPRAAILVRAQQRLYVIQRRIRFDHVG